MKTLFAVALLLACVCPALAQQEKPPEDRIDETGLLPPPAITLFQGRPLYRVGGEIKAPQIVEAPEPEPLKDFRPAKVVLWCVVGIDGKPHMLRVAKHATLEADQKALALVNKYKFKASLIKNQPIDVLMTIDVVWR